MLYYFQGTIKWAKVHTPDPKFGNYEVNLYPDKPSWAAFKRSGLELKIREDDDGKFITLRRPDKKLIKNEIKEFGPPKVMTADLEKFDGNIGNGSKVTVKVNVYDTQKGKGHRLEAIRIDELVEYNKVDVDDSIDIGVQF